MVTTEEVPLASPWRPHSKELAGSNVNSVEVRNPGLKGRGEWIFSKRAHPLSLKSRPHFLPSPITAALSHSHHSKPSPREREPLK